jgi:alkanesulfonate monooxygenase SsuD/methylene tetrahydromethanopterin reductase-like flavin-dependent oxidoreductase (luciferase family)
MRVGVSISFQNQADWDRFEAYERGESVPALPATPDATIWDEDLRLCSLVEELGFDSLWFVEHHATPYAMVPNNLQLLAFFAGRTRRIDMGTNVVVLPWHNPLRVAEDITVLQHVLQGRDVYVGLGRGAGRREFRAVGTPMDESRGRFNESVEIIKLALGESRFSYAGEFYTLEDVSLRPRPRDPRALLESLYCAWGSPSTVPIAAAYGLKPLITPQKAWDDYREELDTFGRIRAERGYPPANPIVVACAFCAQSEHEARRTAEQHLAEMADATRRNYELGGSHFATTRGYEHYATQAPLPSVEQMVETHVWGTPDLCLEKIEGLAASFHPSKLVVQLRFGGMPADVAEQSMRLFAAEVLPAVHELAVEPPLIPTR